MKVAAPETAGVVPRGKNFRIAAKSVAKQTARKRMGNGSRKRTRSRIISIKSAKQTSRSQRSISTNFFH